jgi:hypothetical protein
MLRYKLILVTVAVLGALLCACGGGGSSSSQPSQPPLQAKMMIWKAPQYFMDNSLLNPATDLQRFEIYIRQDPSFGPGDNAIATASPVENSFNLATLVPPLSKGVTYYVSVRAVTVEDEKSDFSPAFSFSLTN